VTLRVFFYRKMMTLQSRLQTAAKNTGKQQKSLL